MNNRPFAIGDLVSIKDYSLKDEYLFVWDIIQDGIQQQLVVNVTAEVLKDKKFKKVEDKSHHRLFSTYEYAYVSGYNLLRVDDIVLGNDYDFLKEIIEMRGPYNFMAELVFLYLLQSIKDKHAVDKIMLDYFIPTIINDPYCSLPATEILSFNSDKMTRKLKATLAPIILMGNGFWLMKRMKNFSTIADSVITEDGRSILVRIKEDKNLLESLLQLFNSKENYKTANYSPLNTKANKPISHNLNQSYYGLFQEEVDSFSKLQEEKKQWIESLDVSHKKMAPDNMEENLLSGCFPQFQELLFSDLGEEIPVKKIANGRWSLDYNLALYIPIFKWLMPDVFKDRIPHMNESDLRKYHIRKIRDFTQGKI